MKKIYLITFLTLLLAKHCYSSGAENSDVIFKLIGQSSPIDQRCPQEVELSGDTKGRLFFGNNLFFYLKDRPELVDVQEVCTYKTKYTSSFTDFSSDFSLVKVITRTKCLENNFNGTVTYQLIRDADQILYKVKFVDTASKTIGDFSCKYQK